MKFHELISAVIDLEQDIGELQVRELIANLEGARDLAVEIIKNLKKDSDVIPYIKKTFSIHSYDPGAKALMEDLELYYWRIMK